jgi:hypothetical protein
VHGPVATNLKKTPAVDSDEEPLSSVAVKKEAKPKKPKVESDDDDMPLGLSIKKEKPKPKPEKKPKVCGRESGLFPPCGQDQMGASALLSLEWCDANGAL